MPHKREKVFDSLVKFIRHDWGISDIEITRKTELEDELGITGDDAVEFLVKFGSTFHVDVTKFMARDYFGPERWVFLSSFFERVTRQKRQRKTLTVGHLEKAIVAGRLDEEVING